MFAAAIEWITEKLAPLLGVALVLALIGLGAQRIEIANLEAAASKVEAKDAKQEAQRSAVAASDAVNVIGAERTHGATQQEIVHELVAPDPSLAADALHARAIAERLRFTESELAAARDRAEAASRPVAPGDCPDQRGPLLELLREGAELSGQSASLAVESRSVLAGRDKEVKALKGLVIADRALMDQAASQPK